MCACVVNSHCSSLGLDCFLFCLPSQSVIIGLAVLLRYALLGCNICCRVARQFWSHRSAARRNRLSEAARILSRSMLKISVESCSRSRRRPGLWPSVLRPAGHWRRSCIFGPCKLHRTLGRTFWLDCSGACRWDPPAGTSGCCRGPSGSARTLLPNIYWRPWPDLENIKWVKTQIVVGLNLPSLVLMYRLWISP